MKTLTLVRKIGALASWFGPSLLGSGAENTFGSGATFQNTPASPTTHVRNGNARNPIRSVLEASGDFNRSELNHGEPSSSEIPDQESSSEITVPSRYEHVWDTLRSFNQFQRFIDDFTKQMQHMHQIKQMMNDKDEKINQLENIINAQNQQLEQSNHQLEQAREEIRELTAFNLKMMQSRIQDKKEIRRQDQLLLRCRETLKDYPQRPSVQVTESSQLIDGQIIPERHQVPITAGFIQKELVPVVPNESGSSFQTPLTLLSDLALWDEDLASFEASRENCLFLLDTSLRTQDEEEDLC